MAEIRVGISGWTYPPWRGNFYPEGLIQKLELAYASRRFGMLEINGTFYSLQKPSSFGAWYDATPPGFVFSLKGNKFVTHVKRLKDPHEPVGSFLGSGLLRLREKLGPILWQLPPFMTFDEERVRTFVSILPHDTRAMAAFAKKHSSLDAERMELEVDENRPVRHAIEFRNESFVTARFLEIVREHNVAMVIADEASKFPSGEDVTADWVYIRLHGERVGHESGYTPEEIAAWGAKARIYRDGGEPPEARRIGGESVRMSAKVGRDVFIAFDNTEIKQRSPVNARQMAEELGVGPRGSPSEVLGVLGAKGTPPEPGSAAAQKPFAPKTKAATGFKKAASKKAASKKAVAEEASASSAKKKRPTR